MILTSVDLYNKQIQAVVKNCCDLGSKLGLPSIMPLNLVLQNKGFLAMKQKSGESIKSEREITGLKGGTHCPNICTTHPRYIRERKNTLQLTNKDYEEARRNPLFYNTKLKGIELEMELAAQILILVMCYLYLFIDCLVLGEYFIQYISIIESGQILTIF